jgi:hypothetical protein
MLRSNCSSPLQNNNSKITEILNKSAMSQNRSRISIRGDEQEADGGDRC